MKIKTNCTAWSKLTRRIFWAYLVYNWIIFVKYKRKCYSVYFVKIFETKQGLIETSPNCWSLKMVKPAKRVVFAACCLSVTSPNPCLCFYGTLREIDGRIFLFLFEKCGVLHHISRLNYWIGSIFWTIIRIYRMLYPQCDTSFTLCLLCYLPLRHFLLIEVIIYLPKEIDNEHNCTQS